MTTIANKYRPNTFKDFIGQGNNEGGEVDLIKQIIKNNLHEQSNVIVLEGPSGSSKSTLARLYAQATLCPNRPEKDYEPCGTCPVCLGEDSSNIYSYTITSSPEAREPIRSLVDKSLGLPINFGVRSDQYRQFIIIDEVENATPELLATLLEPLEHCPKTTTWILNTMDYDKLRRRDVATFNAIDSRALVFHLKPFSEEEITFQLTNKVKLLEPTAKALSSFSEGNMRQAWSLFSKLTLKYPELKVNELTVENVFDTLGGGAHEISRFKMWRALLQGNTSKVLNYFNNWKSKGATEKLLLKLLTEDLVHNLNPENKDTLELLRDLSHWCNLSVTYPLAYTFLPYALKEVIPLPEEKEVKKLKVVKSSKVNALELLESASTQLGVKLDISNIEKPRFFSNPLKAWLK